MKHEEHTRLSGTHSAFCPCNSGAVYTECICYKLKGSKSQIVECKKCNELRAENDRLRRIMKDIMFQKALIEGEEG